MEGKMKKNPEEMTTWEFLDAHLYQQALDGRFQAEFNLVKERLDCLKPFQGPKDFMKATWNDKALRGNIAGQLKRLWRSDSGVPPQAGLANSEFKQASGLVLMLAMWRNAIAAGDDYWFRFFSGPEKEGAL